MEADWQRYEKIWDEVEDHGEGPSTAKVTKTPKVVESVEQDGVAEESEDELDDASPPNSPWRDLSIDFSPSKNKGRK